MFPNHTFLWVNDTFSHFGLQWGLCPMTLEDGCLTSHLFPIQFPSNITYQGSRTACLLLGSATIYVAPTSPYSSSVATCASAHKETSIKPLAVSHLRSHRCTPVTCSCARLQPLKKVYFFKKRYTVIIFQKKVYCDTFSKKKVYCHTFFHMSITYPIHFLGIIVSYVVLFV